VKTLDMDPSECN